MEDQIVEKAKKEADEMWEKELKPDFSKYINTCLVESLKELKDELQKFDNSMKSHIQSLDQQFENKFMEQIEKVKKQLKEKAEKK